jgi:hypothetical protein
VKFRIGGGVGGVTDPGAGGAVPLPLTNGKLVGKLPLQENKSVNRVLLSLIFGGFFRQYQLFRVVKKQRFPRDVLEPGWRDRSSEKAQGSDHK